MLDINSKKTRSIVMVSFIVFLVMYALLAFSNIGSLGVQKFNDGFGTFDEHLMGYSLNMVYTVLSMMGEVGINHYLKYFIFDYIFLISGFVVQLAFSIWIAKKSKVKFLGGTLVLFTVLKSSADFLENTMLIIIIKSLPNKLEILCKISSALTRIKMITFVTWIIILIITISVICIKKIRR